MSWVVLIPIKESADAKSRLREASPDDAAHARLVAAIRADTLAAAQAAVGVERVVLVHGPGLNEALTAAAAGRAWVAALVGDLPALRADELAAALADAQQHPRAFVADHAGTGTTLLTARDTELAPRFGLGSAARHALDAVRLPAGPGLRHDVDTAADLRLALALGVGPHTAGVSHIHQHDPA